jgi:penicillin-binding protein 2
MKLSSLAFNKRLLIFGLVLAMILLIILGRLIQLQIHLTMSLFQRSQRNFTRFETVASPRGNIVDCNGKLLATNRPVIAVYWQGAGNKHLSDEQLHLIKSVETIAQKKFSLSLIAEAERLHKKTVLMHDISNETLSRLAEQFPNNPQILLATQFKRFYPHGTLASHLLGYICVTYDEQGTMGLEKLLNDALKGIPGELTRMINSTGKHLEEKETKKALAGQTINSTIDLEKQKIAEAVFPEGYAGALLVMHPRTGSIEALVSRPTFNPNIFLKPISTEEWQKLQEDKPFLNRAFNAYPPASLFKLITLTAALESNLIHPEDRSFCTGALKFAGRDYHCNLRAGHGNLNLTEALAKSCNIPFFEIGKRINIDTLADYAHRFGLGMSTESIFPEKKGLIPTSSWKRKVKGEAWWPGETLSAAIGQTFLLATPIQLARLVSSIGEGYLVKPRILSSEPIERQELDVSSTTLQFIKQTMKEVTSEGTGQRLSSLKNFDIYAKTGTAQVKNLSHKNEFNKKDLEHAWYIAYLHYAHHDPFTLVILIEHAGSARIATRTAKQFALAYAHLMDTGTLLIDNSPSDI